LGVALLADRYARRRGLDHSQARCLVAGALLHDIGHGPLSHSLEPVFGERFGIDHHTIGHTIVLDRSPGGVGEILDQGGVAPESVADLIAGRAGGPHAFLFAGPITLDTLDGICRSALYLARDSVIHPLALVDSIAADRPDGSDRRRLDAFWELKNAVYRDLIGGSAGVQADRLVQRTMCNDVAQYRRSDFLLDDRAFFRRHPGQFRSIMALRQALVDVRRIGATVERLPVQRRRYRVDPSVPLKGVADLYKRYLRDVSDLVRIPVVELSLPPPPPPALFGPDEGISVDSKSGSVSRHCRDSSIL
jgi:hypothetical protein